MILQGGLMIYDKIENIVHYDTTNMALKKAMGSIMNKDFLDFEDGKTTIDGEKVYAMKVGLTLKPVEEGVFEAHKKYIDIHVPLKNSEDVEVAFVDTLQVTSPYDEEGDCLLGTSDAAVSVHLTPGTFLLVYPDDAHKVGVTKNKSSSYQKVIYKVLV